MGRSVGSVLANFRKLFLALFTSAVGAMVLFPLVVLVATSLKTRREFFQDTLAAPTSLQFANYVEAWTEGGFQTYMVNSVIVVFVALAVLLAVSLLAAYALVHFDLPAKRSLLLFVVAGFMVPPQVLITPLFTIMNRLGWVNEYQSLIVVYVAMAVPFSVFFLRQFFLTLPRSIGEAARMDGCSELQVFTRVYLPLSVPAVTTVFVFQFVLFWNEFLYALLFMIDDAKRTAPAGLLEFQGMYGQDFTLLATGILIAAIPAVVVFMLLRNYFVEGFRMGGT